MHIDNLKINKMTQARIKKIINKMNEGQEEDVPKYTWETIPKSSKKLWEEHFKNNKK